MTEDPHHYLFFGADNRIGLDRTNPMRARPRNTHAPGKSGGVKHTTWGENTCLMPMDQRPGGTPLSKNAVGCTN